MAWYSVVPRTRQARIAAVGLLLVVGACGDDGLVDSPVAPELPRFTEIAAGARHTCALAADGVAWCWGLDDDGQTGPAVGASAFVPATVSTTLRFVGIAAGSRHSCGLTEGGSVYCWGLGPWGGGPVPSLIEGSDGFTEISSVHGHVCATTTAGEVACFGDAARGQLGPAVPPSGESSATPVHVGGLSNIQRVAAGKNHTCGLLESGGVECWGDDAIGQLGLDRGGSESCNWVVDSPGETRPCQLAPMRVIGTALFVSLAAGHLHTCAIGASGDGYCWGASAFGQLGSGTTQPGVGPELVAGGHAWVTLSGGLANTCGITVAGEAYCWGDGSLGQLGSSLQISRRARPGRRHVEQPSIALPHGAGNWRRLSDGWVSRPR